MHLSSIERLDEVMSNLHDCPFELNRATSTWARVLGLAFFRGRFGTILAPNIGLLDSVGSQQAACCGGEAQGFRGR